MKAKIKIIQKLIKRGLILFAAWLITLFSACCVYGEGIEVDTFKPHYAATMKETGNGTPQVDIVRPDATGCSHNKFIKYNVSEKGVAINNGIHHRLGGGFRFMEANPNLKESGPATTILFEVTGASKSELKGATTISGKEADFILINPNGIICNGGEFINTPSVVLSTQRLDGQFMKDVVVEGKGLKSNGDTYLKGKRILVKGPITSKELIRLEANLEKKGLMDEENLVAIDISKVASIKAGSIYMIATNKGIGVRSLGKLESTVADIVVETEGKVELKHLTQSAGDVSLQGSYVEAINMKADGLYLYTKGKPIIRNAFLDSISIIDLDADGERTLEYALADKKTPRKIRFIGKSFDILNSLAVLNLELDLTSKTPWFNNASLSIIGNFTYAGDCEILNTGSIRVGEDLKVLATKFTNRKEWEYKLWAGNPNKKEQVAIPNTGEICAGSMKVITTEGDFLNIDGGIIETTDSEGDLCIDSNGKIELAYFTRKNGRGQTEEGYDFQPSYLKGSRDVVLLSRTREVNSKASIIEVGGNFNTSAFDSVTCTSANGQYYSYSYEEKVDRERSGWGWRDKKELRHVYEYPKLLGELRLSPSGNVTIVTQLGDIDLEGLNAYFGSAHLKAGRDFINKAAKVHNNFGLGGSAGAGGNQLGMGDISKLITMGVDPVWLQKQPVQSESNLATGSGFNFEGGNIIGQNSITIEAGRHIVNEGGFIGAVKGDVKVKPGVNEGEGDFYNKVLGGAYIDSHVREKHYEALSQAITLRPGIVISLYGNVLLDAKNKDLYNEGILAAGGKVKVDGRLHNTAVVVEGKNYQKVEDEKFLSKVTTEQWTSNTIVSQPAIYGKHGIELEPDAELHDKGGLYCFPNGTLSLPGKVQIENFVHDSVTITKVTEKGINTVGIWEGARAKANGASSKQSLSYVPFFNAFINLAETRSVTDLQPAVEAGTTVFQATEEYARNYLAMSRDGLAASVATAKTLLDIGPLGVLPDGLGVYEKTTTYKQTIPIQLRTRMEGQEVICNLENGYIEGLHIKADKGICFRVEDNLEFAASEVTATQAFEQEHKGVGARVGKTSFSVSGYYQKAEGHSEQINKDYVYLEAPNIEFHGKGTVNGPVVIKANNVKIDELSQLKLDSVQETSQVSDRQSSLFVGFTWLAESTCPIPTVGISQGKGEGHSQWVNEQGGIYSTGTVTINVDKLSLNGVMVNAPVGEIHAKEIDYNDIRNEEKYEHKQAGLSTYLLGQLLAGDGQKSLPAAPPEVDNKAGSTSVWGMFNFGYDKEEKEGITRATVASGIDIQTDSDIAGLNRDVDKAQEVTSQRDIHISGGIPLVDRERFINNMQQISETAQDLKNGLLGHFDEMVANIPADQPELKAQMEAIKENFSEIAEDVAEEVIKLANSENALERLQEKQKSILKEKSIEEANFEELQSLSNEMEKERSTIRFSDVRDIEGVPIVLGHPGYREALLKKYRIELKGENTLQEIAQELPLEEINRFVEDLRNEVIAEAQWMHDQSVKMVKVVYDNRVVIIEKTLNGIQVGLDVGGVFVPIIPDVANAAIHAGRGHYGEMMLSLAAAVPIAGEVATVAKYAVKGADAAKEVYAFTKKEIPLEKRLIESNFPKEKVGGAFTEANELGGAKNLDVASSPIGTRVLDGDYGNPRVVGMYEKISHEIPKGRIDYSNRFLEDLKNFEHGTSTLHSGPLKEDLYLINYHDYAKKIGLGKDDRTMKWATHVGVGNKMPTIDDVHQHLALVKPDWGKRDAVTLIKIPKGTDVTFISGKAKEQVAKEQILDAKEKFRGGGFQIRFGSFNEEWIVKTEKIK